MVVCEIGTFMYDSFISVDVSYEVEQNLYDIINVSIYDSVQRVY